MQGSLLGVGRKMMQMSAPFEDTLFDCLASMVNMNISDISLNETNPFEVYPNGTYLHVLVYSNESALGAFESLDSSDVRSCMCDSIHESYLQCLGPGTLSMSSKSDTASSEKKRSMSLGVGFGLAGVAGLALYAFIRKRRRDQKQKWILEKEEETDILFEDSNALSYMNPMMDSRTKYKMARPENEVAIEMTNPRSNSVSVFNPLYEDGLKHAADDIVVNFDSSLPTFEETVQESFESLQTLFENQATADFNERANSLLEVIRNDDRFVNVQESIIMLQSVVQQEDMLNKLLHENKNAPQEMRVSIETLLFELNNVKLYATTKKADDGVQERFLDRYTKCTVALVGLMDTNKSQMTQNIMDAHNVICNSSSSKKTFERRANVTTNNTIETDIQNSIAKLRRVNRASIDQRSTTAVRIKARRRWMIIKYAIILNGILKRKEF
jgi:hypothetical protein